MTRLEELRERAEAYADDADQTRPDLPPRPCPICDGVGPCYLDDRGRPLYHHQEHPQ